MEKWKRKGGNGELQEIFLKVVLWLKVWKKLMRVF